MAETILSGSASGLAATLRSHGVPSMTEDEITTSWM
jgi:hypothetical protein